MGENQSVGMRLSEKVARAIRVSKAKKAAKLLKTGRAKTYVEAIKITENEWR